MRVLPSLVFLLPASVFAQEFTVNDNQLWRSKDLDNRFYGFFFPPTDVDGENFKTCENILLKVRAEEVERVEVSQECDGEPTPFKVIQLAELADQVEEIKVIGVDNESVGLISDVYLSKISGDIAGFLVRKPGVNGDEYLSVSANDLTIWDTSSGSLALLFPETARASIVPGVLPMGGEGLNRQIFSSYGTALEAFGLQDIVSVSLASKFEDQYFPVTDGLQVFVPPNK